MNEDILNSRFSNLLIKYTKNNVSKKNPNEKECFKKDIDVILDASPSPYANERRNQRTIVQLSREEKHPIAINNIRKPKVISSFNHNEFPSLKIYNKNKDNSVMSTKIEVPVNSKNKAMSFLHSKVDSASTHQQNQYAKDAKDILDLLTSKTILEKEDMDENNSKIKGLNVELLTHQVQGLRFLEGREKLPGPVSGGLLCDDMGLGKTVQMIALMLEHRQELELKEKVNLIICPVSLINQWNNEILSKAPGLVTLIFHGSKRTRDYKELLKYDAVITSYSTVSSEFHMHDTSPLFSIEWWRVILDEAHQIKSSRTKQAEACYHIKSSKRWCVTGTPIQNNLVELHSLLRFIQVSKYSSPKEWKKIPPSKKASINTLSYSIEDLKEELDTIMLRRTKKILKSSSNFTLPPKKVHNFYISFSEFERKLYQIISDKIRKKILNMFALNSGKKRLEKGISSQSTDLQYGGYNSLSALVFLLRLRQVCCNWRLVFQAEAPKKPTSTSEIDDISQQMSKLSVESNACNICQKLIMKSDEVICNECNEFYSEGLNLDNTPSKFKTLMDILLKERGRETVVFSQFVTVLKQLDLYLRNNNFKTFLYTGQSSLKEREEILLQVKKTKGAILLCSLKCSSVGLNLVFASRVIIMDPYWNPAIQDQAIDRVYRIGQCKPVDVYELIVKDTVEENIVKLQDRKRKLADQIISNDKLKSKESNKKLSQDEIFELLGISNDKRVAIAVK